MSDADKVTKTINQERFYASYLDAVSDAKDFINSEGVFNDRQPRPREWSLVVDVIKAQLYKAETGGEKHRVAFTMTITGTEDRIKKWGNECRKLYGVNKNSLHVSNNIDLAAARAEASEQKSKYQAEARTKATE
jgi:hypothetical protein